MALISKDIVDKLCPELKPGPLSSYRDSATFCWRQMRVKMFTEEGLEVCDHIWKRMEQDPIFAQSEVTLPLDVQRQLTYQRVRRLCEWKTNKLIQNSSPRGLAFIYSMGMYDWSLLARKILMTEFITMNVLGSGTKFHRDNLVKPFMTGEFRGCFCLTEMSHGSNSKDIRTTATYINETDEIELHTPDFEAAKAWSGNLGETATHASTFAQLFTVDKKTGVKTCRGMHNFIVPIRNPGSSKLYPGLIVGDMGEKLGLNGMDNGFMMFDHYRIPRECLLDAAGGISKDGNYVSPYRDPSKRFGASLGNLSNGRVGLVTMTVTNLHLAVVIAIRYSAARKQFGGTEKSPEWSVIEYQSQQCRLFPYLAASFVILKFGQTIGNDLFRFHMARAGKEDPDLIAAMGREIHGLSSAAKPLSSWVARDAIQEAREACGGHGYLKCSRFGLLRGDNDASCTFEGDNNVLIQQTSNWLISEWKKARAGEKIQSPFGSLFFLNRRNEHLNKSFSDWSRTPNDSNFVLEILENLITRLLKSTCDYVEGEVAKGRSEFQARNDSQFFLARDLAMCFIETTALGRFLCDLNEVGVYNDKEKSVLNELAYLYGLSCVEKYVPQLLKLGVISSGKFVNETHKEIIATCRNLKPNAVALADALAPPDFILNSALGHSSGDIYKQMQLSFYSVPGGFERAAYWQELTEDHRNKSKL